MQASTILCCVGPVAIYEFVAFVLLNFAWMALTHHWLYASLAYTTSHGAWSYIGSKCSIGEGNGNPLQYSYLENPMGGGAW